jgi:hypothetical protein
MPYFVFLIKSAVLTFSAVNGVPSITQGGRRASQASQSDIIDKILGVWYND